jgi:hypothetical protein
VVDRAIASSPDTTVPLDRSAQALPIPLGGLSPAHRRSTPLRRTLRRHRSAPMFVLALAASCTGVWLSTGPRSFDVGQDPIGIHVDDITLTRASQLSGGEVFTGAATVVIRTTPSGAVRAGAVMTWNGVRATGRCALISSAQGARETCVYEIGATRLTSNDTFVARTRTWSRRYGDGVEIAINLPIGSALIPVPFPLGR